MASDTNQNSFAPSNVENSNAIKFILVPQGSQVV